MWSNFKKHFLTKLVLASEHTLLCGYMVHYKCITIIIIIIGCLIVLNWTEINLLGLLNVFPIHFKLKLKYFPVTMLISRFCWQDTSHHKVAILLFHGGDLVSLITFEWTILYQAVSCFSAKNVLLLFQSFIYLYLKKVRGK